MHFLAMESIDRVLAQMDEIIEESLDNASRAGIFACIYRRTTAAIKSAIERKTFDDNHRMVIFDVNFADLYLSAYRGFKQNQEISRSWAVSFESNREELAVIQHLIMGMHAHISLDLGIAAAETMQSEHINKLLNDYAKINHILAALTDSMQASINRISPVMSVLDIIGGKMDERLANMSIAYARNRSWLIARELWLLQDHAERQQRIREIDEEMAVWSEYIRKPPSRFLRACLKGIKTFEPKDVRKVIAVLRKAD
jgi:hypothetical protein